MATVSELLGYQGSGGLGSNPSIPVSNPNELGFTNTVLRDIALQDAQKNILLYKQKKQDQEKLMEALASGAVKVGDILERDMPRMHKALDDQTNAFRDWMKKGYGDIDAAVAYRKATQYATEVATQAQVRRVFNDKENEASVKEELLPKFQKARQENIESNLTDFWGDPKPYQPTATLNIEEIENFAKPFTTEVTDPKRPFERAKRTYYSYNDALKNAGASFLTPYGSYNLSQLHDTLQSMEPIDRYNKIKTINKELDRYNKERGLGKGDPDYAEAVVAVPQYGDKGELIGLQLNEPLDKLAAKFSLAGQAQYQNDVWALDKTAEAMEKMKIARENAQSNRIRANAAQQRASAYGRLQNIKAKQMTDSEARIKGFWDGIVGKVKDLGLVGGGHEDMVLAEDLPKGYRNINGLDSKGQPIALEPLSRGKDNKTKYYETRYYNGKTGDAMTKDFLREAYQRGKSAGKLSGSFDDYLKSLIKNGNIDLELVGKNGTANFSTALQTAQSLSNKSVSQKTDEPLFQQTEAIGIPEEEEE